MKWNCEQIENLMNYIRIWYDAGEVFMFDIDRDRICFWNYDHTEAHSKDLSNLYYEMLDKTKEMC